MDIADRLRLVRFLAATGSGLVAVVYLLIGTNVIHVIEGQGPGLGPPMLIAAALFAVLAVMLVLSGSRVVWITGAALQLLVLFGYLVISVERTPAFEAWGIVQKVLQLALFVAFTYLLVQRRPRPTFSAGGRRSLSRA